MQLGHHGLYLGPVEHAHKYGLNDVIIMVAQGNLIAAQGFGMVIEIAPPHPGTEVAG